MKRHSRAEMLELTGARPEELEELEASRLLVPYRRWSPLALGEVYYRDSQLDVLRWFVETRRVAEASRTRGAISSLSTMSDSVQPEPSPQS